MRQLVWSNTFRRALRRSLRRQPHLRSEIESTLRLLQEDPFAPRLATHKLKGKLRGIWACSAAFDLRILFELVPSEKGGEDDVFLLEIGTHEEVY
jgi:mRNA-degrading endonuclease YafQ of YafQ-DinJ toxin-antitoxin module